MAFCFCFFSSKHFASKILLAWLNYIKSSYDMKPTWGQTRIPKENLSVKAEWMFMCYYTYCKNNRHNHSPTWKFVTTLKIVTFPVSTQFQTPVPNIQCLSPGVWFFINIQAQQLMCSKVFLSPQLESLVWELILSLHCFWGAGPSCFEKETASC